MTLVVLRRYLDVGNMASDIKSREVTPVAIELGKINFSFSNLQRRVAHPWHVGRTLLANAGIDRNYRKVFAIGFHKTATTSIHEVFLKAGLRATHSVTWQNRKLVFEHFAYQAFSDGPPEDFTLFDRHFPGSLFILNTRDLDEWIESRIAHFRYMNNHPGLNRPFVKGRRTDADSIKRWIHHRNTLHLQMLRYFRDRPDDLLVVNYIRDPHAAERISQFIGAEAVKEKPFARSIPKVREARDGKNRDLIEGCFHDLGIPEAEWRNDIYCPSLENETVRAQWPADTSELVRD